MAESENIALVEHFLQCWRGGDAAAFGPLFTEDAVYQDGPRPPVQGREAIVAFIARIYSGWEFLDTQVRHLAAAGDIVFVERVDRWRNRTSGREGTIPAASVFEVRDGRLAAGREYYDARSFERQWQDEPIGREGA